MVDAERPEALWLALRMVQAVLRGSPSALACSSSVRNSADLTASTSSLILEDCRAFILAVGRSGRWVRACTRAAEDGRNISERVIVDVPRRLDRAVDQAVEVAGTVVGDSHDVPRAAETWSQGVE